MKTWIKYLLGMSFGFFILFLMLIQIDFDILIDHLNKINWLYLFPITIAYLLTWFFRGERWKLILESSKIRISRIESIRLIFLGNMMNLAVPAKMGDVGRLAGLSKTHSKDDVTKAAGTIIVDRFFDFFTIIVLIILTLPWISNKTSLPSWVERLILICIITVSVVFAVLILLAKNSEYRDKMISKLPQKIQHQIEKLVEGLLSVFDNSNLFLLIIYSLIIWIGDTYVSYLVFRSINLEVPFTQVLFCLLIANLTKTIPITPGGIGVFEATVANLLVLYGYEYDSVVLGAIIDHMIKNIITLIGGVICAIYLSISIFKLKDDKSLNDRETIKK